MRGHLLVGRAAGEQRVRGARVQALALGRRELVVDSGAHDRVHERQLAGRLEEAAAHEVVGRVRSGLLVEPGEVRGGRPVRGPAEHRDGSGERDGRRAQARQAVADHVLHGAGADALHGLHGGRARRVDALLGERVEQLADEQRVPSGHAVAGVAEPVWRLWPEALAHQARDRRLAQRTRSQHGHRRIGGQLGQQRAVLAGLGVARGHDEQDAQFLDAPREVAGERHRAGVGPVQVVDHDDHRAAVGDVHEEPEQPVQQLELRVGPVRPRALEHRAGGAGRLGEQQLALLARGGAHGALEQLAHDAEREAPLELRPAPPQHLGAGVTGERARHLADRRLADPRRAHDRHDLPAAAWKPVQRPDERAVLGAALEQSREGEGPRHGPRLYIRSGRADTPEWQDPAP